MEEENRDNSFELRVSEKERNYLTGKNRGTGVSKGKSLRNTVKNKPAGEQPPAEVIVLVRELRRVRYVFEEILKVAYMSEELDLSALEVAISENRTLEEMIADAYKRACYITIEQPSFSDQGNRLQAMSYRLNMASYAEEWQTSYSERKQEKGNEIPLWKKATLSINEAAAYTSIGENKLRELSSDGNCGFVLWVGQKRLIKRKQFEEYLEKVYSI